MGTPKDRDPQRPDSDIRLSNSRPRVLVVDDERAMRLTTSELLALEFRVFTAANAEEALAVVSAETIDVICTDFKMPGMDGLQLLAEASQRDPFIAGVLMTGHREYLARTRAQKELDYQVLLKPFDPEQLLELVRRALKTAALKRTLSDSARRTKIKPER
jgi:DNA-binding NtrC family response regulator